MKLCELTNNQRALFASYVQQAADMGLSHICDDTNEGDYEEWSDEEKQQLCKLYNKWNNVSDEDEDERMENVCMIGASSLVSIAAWILSPDAEAEKLD